MSMASVSSASFCYSKSRIGGVKPNIAAARPRSLVVVSAEAQAINPEIRKTEEKVVDSVMVAELSKPLTAYCRYTSVSVYQKNICLCCGSLLLVFLYFDYCLYVSHLA
jgi:hypothetical protein